MNDFPDRFLQEVAGHELQVIRDEGVHRHLRFKRHGTYCMHFDLITWPGYLCYTGDMGTYVFKRLTDMLEFFRVGEGRQPYSIDLRYWAEKIEASDKGDGVREWSADKFKAEVRDYFDQAHDEDDDPEAKAELWEEIEAEVCFAADNGEHWAWVALHEFSFDGFRFQDWERDCKVWSHRFLWCCHALRWGIARYDEHRAAIAAATGAQAGESHE